MAKPHSQTSTLALPCAAEPCHSSVQLSSMGRCLPPTPVCAFMTPSFQGREHNISFLRHGSCSSACPTQGSDPVAIISPRRSSTTFTWGRRHREHHLPHAAHESPPQRRAGASPRHRIPALCPQAAEENQPKGADLASRQHRPHPSFLPPRATAFNSHRPCSGGCCFLQGFAVWGLWSMWARWLQREKLGLPPLPPQGMRGSPSSLGWV